MHTLTLTTEELEAVYDALTSVPRENLPHVDSVWLKVREALPHVDGTWCKVCEVMTGE